MGEMLVGWREYVVKTEFRGFSAKWCVLLIPCENLNGITQ